MNIKLTKIIPGLLSSQHNSSLSLFRRLTSLCLRVERAKRTDCSQSSLLLSPAREVYRQWAIFFFIILMLAVPLVFTNCSQSNPAQPSSSALAPSEEIEGKLTTKQEKTLFHCPMHPSYISDKPGDCPICGMSLVPVEKEERKEAASMPAGTIEISPQRQQLIGVTFGQVERRELHQMISAYGRLTYDETRLATITTKFSGWIEKLFVDYTGKFVRRGEPLFSIYSPDLVAAQEEYLLALRAEKILNPLEDKVATGVESKENSNRKQQIEETASSTKINNLQNTLVKKAGPEEPGQSISVLVEAAKRRLLLWDISEEQITRLEKERRPFRDLTIFSPVAGFVTEKNVVQGKFVMAGENLLSLADLSQVWLLADIYELDQPLVSVGQEVEVEVASFPGEKFRGRISHIYPYLENESRTVKVRIEFPNPGYRLKPEMYGQVKIHLRLGNRLSVPEEAVIDTGERKVVFIAHEPSHFEPREVNLGRKAGGFYEVLSGLEEGERVLTSAQFLIDSESRLKEAIQGFHQHPAEEKPEPKEKKTPPPPAKHVH